MTPKTTTSLCILAVVLSLASLAISIWTVRVERKAIRDEIYGELVQELDSVLMPAYARIPVEGPTPEERKTIKGLLSPFLKIGNKIH
jgi:hypothetical protein